MAEAIVGYIPAGLEDAWAPVADLARSWVAAASPAGSPPAWDAKGPQDCSRGLLRWKAAVTSISESAEAASGIEPLYRALQACFHAASCPLMSTTIALRPKQNEGLTR